MEIGIDRISVYLIVGSYLPYTFTLIDMHSVP
jgi:hypothetical protein